jgi:PKD repeat protein
MKHLLSSSLGILLAALVLGNSEIKAQHQHVNCGSHLSDYANQYPDFWEGYVRFVEDLKEYKSLNLGQFETAENGKRIIPVVVHVIHEGGSENISTAQILSQLASVNLDFTYTNADKVVIPPYFDSIAANANIEFRLATKAPNGACTDGINRVYSYKTNTARDYTGFKALSYWDRAKYLNIWVVKTIDNDGNPFGNILGYAQFPYSFGGQNPVTTTDGIAMIHNRTGKTGTAAGTAGRTMTHEVGHWLGLIHIWGDETCGNDQVDDTPFSRQPNFGCFNFPKEATCIELTTNSTAADTAARFQIGEMFNNYMDYTDDNCMNMFSKGQKQVMDFVFSTISFRSNLITNANALATGTDDAAQASPCGPTPIADFWSKQGTNNFESLKMICAGSSLNMKNGTHNGSTNGNSYAWELNGAVTTTSADPEPLVQYNTPGRYDVKLTSTNANGSGSKTRPGYVMVSSQQSMDNNYKYYDAMEAGTGYSFFADDKWVMINEGADQSKGWEKVNYGGYKSYGAARCNSTGSLRYERFFMVSPSYNLTTVDNPLLEVKFAYAQRTNQPFITQNDQLQMYVSTNCGESWQLRGMKLRNQGTSLTSLAGTNLVTAGLVASNFVPSSPDEWSYFTVDLANFTNRDNVRIMFHYTSGGPFGNPLYIDDFTISNASTAVEDLPLASGFKMHPNPASGNVQIQLDDAAVIGSNIEVFDLAGRLIHIESTQPLIQGAHTLTLQRSVFGESGLYLVKAIVNGQSQVRRLIIQ